MAIYSYSAKNAAGKVLKGQLVAANEQGLIDALKQQGATLMSSKTFQEKSDAFTRFFEQLQGVPIVQKIFFTQNIFI